jgi:hypothetical protein
MLTRAGSPKTRGGHFVDNRLKFEPVHKSTVKLGGPRLGGESGARRYQIGGIGIAGR